MDSLVEKITLYDVMSYFIPGFLCSTLLVFGLVPELLTHNLGAYDKYVGYMTFTFLILSYVAGIAISDMARCLCDVLSKTFLDKKFSGWNDINKDNENLKKALLKSGMSREKIHPDGNESFGDKQEIMDWIYADIQIDPQYKRIHNYASSESMYKNISMAFLIAVIVQLVLYPILGFSPWSGRIKVFMVLTEFVMAVIFLSRWKTFENKKKAYAYMWFMGKYCAQENI